MKKLLLTFALAGLFLFGCSDVGVNPKVPVNNNQATTTLNKEDHYNNGDSHHQFSMHLATPFSVTKTINGEEGGVIVLDHSWLLGGTSARVYFPANSFEGKKTITMVVNPITASISFQPHMVFNNTVYLDLSFKGLNLDQLDLNSGKVNFYYQADTGLLSLISNGGIHIRTNNGSLEVRNAQLHHFSRYLFAK